MRKDTSKRGLNRRDYLGAIGIGSIASFAGCLGGSSNDDDDESLHFGFSLGSVRDPWLAIFGESMGWYCDDKGIETSITGSEYDPGQQLSDASNMMNSGIDALILNPADSDAGVEIVERANERDIPVFCADVTANTDDVKLFTAFGNYQGGVASAEQIATGLEEQTGERAGNVVEVVLPQTITPGVERHRGFQDQIDEYPDIHIVGEVGLNSTEETEAATNLYNQLQSTEDVDAVFGPNTTTGNGSQTALDRQNMLHEKGSEDHIVFVRLDAPPSALDAIKEGYVDSAIDQPNMFYTALTVEYMREYFDNGRDDSVLPEPGTTLEADDVDISFDDEVYGVNPFQEPIWAPADVETYDDLMPYINTAEVIVTPENADEPYLWGNMQRRKQQNNG